MRKAKTGASPSTKLRAGKFKELRARPFDELRARAEKELKKKIEKIHKESKGDFKRAMHELGVHQIELEIQNEELRRSRRELEDSRNKYSDLYDFAPAGYFTFDKNGLIHEANLTGCQMLGAERAALIKKPFRVFVAKDSHDAFYLHRQAISRSNTKHSCEIAIVRKDKTTLNVLLESISAASADGKVTLCYTAITDITERKNLEKLKEAISQQAIEEKNRLEAVMEALPTGIALLDEKGARVQNNEAFEKIWGSPLPEANSVKDYVKYRAWWADTGKPVKPEEWACIQVVMKGKTVTNQLLEIQRFDGPRAFVLNGASPVRDAKGKIIGSAVAIQDITALRKAEEALRVKDIELQLVADTTPVSLTRLSRDLRYIFANRACAELLGRPREEIVGKSILEVMGEDAFETIRPYVEKVLRGEHVEYEAEIPYKGIGRRFMRVVYVPERSEQGDVVGWIASVQDITERKQAEEEIRKLASVVENSSEFIGLATLDGKIIFQNEAAAGMTGLSAKEAEKSHVLDVVSENFRDKVQNEYLSALKKKGHWEGELQYLNVKTGKITDVYATTFTINDPDTGKPLYLANTSLDITERKLAEDALKQSKAELERSNKELEEFARITSHDLREPLRAISGFIELLDLRHKDKWDEKDREYIKYSTNGAKQIEELLNGLLEYSRVATQGRRVMPLPAGLALKAAIKNLQKPIDETGASITFDKLPDVNADGRQLTQVFQNLIDNAIKFRDEKKPQIHVGCRKGGPVCPPEANTQGANTQVRPYWQFSVRDNGIGIDKQDHERIFKIFQHLHPQDKYPGYGVGLTICQKIVERHGGKIWVESKPGQGTTFYFTIPE